MHEGLLITFKIKIIESGWGSDSFGVTDPPAVLAALRARPHSGLVQAERGSRIESGAFSNSFISLCSHENESRRRENARYLSSAVLSQGKPSALPQVRFRPYL